MKTLLTPLRIAALTLSLVSAARGQTADQTPGKQPAPSPGRTIDQLAERFWNMQMKRRPERATLVGDPRYNDKLEDVSEAADADWAHALVPLMRDIDAVPLDNATGRQQLAHTLLRRAVRDELTKLGTWKRFLALDQLSGPHIDFPLLLTAQPFKSEKDYDAYIARLRAFPRQIDQHIANFRKGMQRGISQPKHILQKTLPQMDQHIVKDPRRSEFYEPATREAFSKLSETAQERIRTELTAAIEQAVVPAYQKLRDFTRDEYIPAARDKVGIAHLPRGDKVYEARAALETTTDLLPTAIHKIGLTEVARIRDEMDKIRKELGFTGSLDQFIRHMATAKTNRFENAEQLVAAAREILERTKTKLPELFNNIPKRDCVMKEIESYRAASAPVAYYGPAPEGTDRPGYYYINTYKPQERLRFTLEALSYHESVPGHHFQIALDQENESLQNFRRYGEFTAYVEGWALYTEKLGYEIGGYQTPESRFGQLTFEMWRACRLVVDTGMHAMRWSREKAIDYMKRNTSLADLDIESEIDRYIAWPGQALAYKIGELRILQIRRRAENALKNRFSLRKFHDALLAEGAMPIDLLERRMDAWIDAQVAQAGG